MIRILLLLAGLPVADFISGDVAALSSSAPEPWSGQALSDEATGAAVRRRLPYALEDVERMQKLERENRRSRAFARPVPARGVRSITLALDAGARPPVIRAAQGYVTAIVFLDLTGAPWPVRRVLMRPGFRAAGDDQDARHIIYIAPQQAFDHGNVTVELDGLDLPLSFAIVVDDDAAADFRVAVRLPRAGPAASLHVLHRPGRFQAGHPLLGLFAAGAVPGGATRVALAGGDWRDRAWRYRDRLYLKTPKTLLAPGPLSFERGPDGDWLFELDDTPFAMLSDRGVQFRIAFPGRALLPARIAPVPASVPVPRTVTAPAEPAMPVRPGRAVSAREDNR